MDDVGMGVDSRAAVGMGVVLSGVDDVSCGMGVVSRMDDVVCGMGVLMSAVVVVSSASDVLVVVSSTAG